MPKRKAKSSRQKAKKVMKYQGRLMLGFTGRSMNISYINYHVMLCMFEDGDVVLARLGRIWWPGVVRTQDEATNPYVSFPNEDNM